MKKWTLLLLLLLASARLARAETEWLTNVPAAEAQAQKDHKLMLLYFTGSDWCEWCLRLDAEVLSQPEFTSYAAKNLVLVKLDFPERKPQPVQLQKDNAGLQKKYNVEVFPTLIATKPDGTVVWTMAHYPLGGAKELLGQLDEVRKK